jgi:hypothetical protein
VAGRVEHPARVGPELLVELLAGDVRREVRDGLGVPAAALEERFDVVRLERVAVGAAEALGVLLGQPGARLPGSE